ncbi:MAG: Hsp70 family protein [Campylobacterota bacterium]|nr:Hsp70 family protein [Campylobacterota bacterium]
MQNNLIKKTDKKSLQKAQNLMDIANQLTIKTLLNNSKRLEIKSNTTYIGIDFGTSTTVVSIATSTDDLENLQSDSIELNQKLYDGAIYKSYKIPTMVGWYKNSLLFGEGVNKLKLKLKQGKNLWHSFKMELGEDTGAKYPESELNNNKYTILNPKDVTTLFFKYLKTQIEKYIKENNLSNNIQYSVSIPASFEANQRKDLVDSLHANNMMINKQALIDEPNAAFLSYISDPNLKNNILISEDYPTNILVFDFGAGTCDISILEVANGSKGYYSKNVAISRFEALGGNDIDKLIAKDILFKQFLNENNIKQSIFKRKEINIILSRLEKSAELLKIKASEQLSLISSIEELEKAILSHETIQINSKTDIKSKKGIFKLDVPKISYKEFSNIISSFSTSNIEDYENKDAKTIFTPIISALEKAHLNFDDIDYVLFVGGSAKNPLIQRALKEYFEESEYLIPSNLQALVSSGAAVHSLMYNGYGKNLINPITSEPILVIVKDDNKESLTTLLKAGTSIPCNEITIDNLQIQRENQDTIEIPLYIGNKDKLLHNIKIESTKANGFSIDTNIKLLISVDADKMLIVKVAIDNNEPIISEPLNPFTNKTSTIKDRKKFQIEKQYNNSVANNHGSNNRESLLELCDGYEKLGLDLEAAEILEELHEKFYYGSFNNIGVAYSRAGDEEKAITFYKKDFSEDPSEVSAYNIAMKYRYSDKSKYKEWLEKSLDINSTYEHAMYFYGMHLVSNDDETKGMKMIQKAFDSWESRYNNLEETNIHGNFISCARYLEKYDFANQLEKEKNKAKHHFNEKDFDVNNVLSKKEN